MTRAVSGKSAGRGSRRAVDKRTLTADNLVRTVANCALAFPVIVRSVFKPKTSKVLREKVMLGVTAINDCRYCVWGHTHWATSQGVPLQDINQILSLQNDKLQAHDPAEAAAILFGQRYAEQRDRIDPDALKLLGSHFSESEIREILGYVHFITFTNLSGNTVDAVLERVLGGGRPITVVEGVAGVGLSPVLALLILLVKLGKLVGADKRRAKRNRVAGQAPTGRAGKRASPNPASRKVRSPRTPTTRALER